MKNTALALFNLLLICISCNNTNDITPPITEEPTETTNIHTIDFSSVTGVSEIEDFDIENDVMYFIFNKSIYSVNLNSNTSAIEQIIEDTTDWPASLKVINNILYYQGNSAWSESTNIKQIDLNNVSAGVQSTNAIIGISRSQLCKNADKIVYISSPDGFSPTNNFYELNQSATDKKIATDTFVLPKNMRVIDHYLYFSSQKEIRKLDLNNPTEESIIIYTVPTILNGSDNDGEVIGFDIYNGIIYFSQVSSNKLLAKDLEKPNEAPTTLKTNNNEGETGYGKIIISNGKLYAKKIIDKQIEVFEI